MSLNTKSVSAEFDDLAQTTKYSQPADGSSGNLEVTKSDTGVYTIGFSDGDSVQFALTTGQTTGSVDENDPAGLLIVAQSTDGSKTLKFVSDDINYAAGYGSEVDWDNGAGAIAVFEVGEPVFALPSIETATYKGTLVGVLTDIGLQPVSTEADLRAVANFNLKTLNVQAYNTIAYGLDGVVIDDDYTWQDFDATLTDANGDHTFEGGVTDLDGKSGSITATLYGAEAQAVAVTGFVEDSDQDRAHIFAFGAQR